jgi:sugar/nucleoside kinase (ribokinase family)
MGIDTTNLKFGDTVGTRFLFVYFNEKNDRYFSKYESARSDLEVYEDTLDYSQVKNCKVFDYTPLSQIYDKPIHKATNRLLKAACDAGVKTAYDPNFRFPYEDPLCKKLVIDAIKKANILKLTIEECEYFLGTRDVFLATGELLSENADIIAVTLGAKGCFLRNKKAHVYQPAYDVKVLDTTGAGDSFMGSLIYKLTRDGIVASELNEPELNYLAEFCNACASVSTTRRGSLLVMPSRAEALETMKRIPKLNTEFSDFGSGNYEGVFEGKIIEAPPQ